MSRSFISVAALCLLATACVNEDAALSRTDPTADDGGGDDGFEGSTCVEGPVSVPPSPLGEFATCYGDTYDACTLEGIDGRQCTQIAVDTCPGIISPEDASATCVLERDKACQEGGGSAVFCGLKARTTCLYDEGGCLERHYVGCFACEQPGDAETCWDHAVFSCYDDSLCVEWAYNECHNAGGTDEECYAFELEACGEGSPPDGWTGDDDGGTGGTGTTP
jgi:hypothetical protein